MNWKVEMDDDGDYFSEPVIEKKRKSDRWTLAMLRANREMRRPEMNLFQYAWYTWRGIRIAKRAEKERARKERAYDEWVKQVSGQP